MEQSSKSLEEAGGSLLGPGQVVMDRTKIQDITSLATRGSKPVSRSCNLSNLSDEQIEEKLEQVRQETEIWMKRICRGF